MKRTGFFILSIFSLCFYLSCSVKNNFNFNSREVNFNADWKFVRADVPGAEIMDFDDSQWRTLDLPHDYSIEDLPEKEGINQIGPFSEESSGGASTGHVVGGTAWYRKHFTIEKKDEGKIIKILFDGVYMNADFWINGNHLGNHPYGYTAFAHDLTEYLNPAGQDNVLAVQVKNEGKNSRWYSGSGIYRNVKLIRTNPVHFDLWGNFISTPEVDKSKATINIQSKLINKNLSESEITVSVLIKDQQDTVASTEIKLALNAEPEKTIQQQLEIQNPKLWDTENPYLYTACIQLKKGRKIIDEERLRMGIRSISFSPEDGFLLNGKSVLLKGGCVHHDNGILGSAAFEKAEYRRVLKMKENGFNAIRCAHNPPSEAFLRACDEVGILVMDESFDHWQKPKNDQDYHLYFDDWWERDLESMVLRDRNHPSIIIWSIGNEIKERADSSGLEIARNLKSKIKELDSTRPITQAICSFWDNPGLTWDDTEAAFAQMDVHGYNYQWKRYESDHEKFPERIMIGTESVAQDAFENWEMVEKHPYVIGDFVWTGMDYLGESGIGMSRLDNENISFLPPWPWYNANCGDVSVLGYKKPQMYFRDVVWRNSELEMLVHSPIPSGRKEIVSFWGWPDEWKNWNWQGNEGKPLQVAIYTRCDQVQLELNGQVIGRKNVTEKDSLKLYFTVPYQPGELVAIGYKNGTETVRQSLKTAGKPAVLKITAEEEQVFATPLDLAYFNVEVLDENGILVSDAEIPVEFNIKGKCHLQAVGNGNPRDMKSFQQPKVKTYRGRCQLIVRACDDGDEIIVTAKSEGLTTGSSVVKMVKQ